MSDNFNSLLWELAESKPDLKKALLSSIGKTPVQYSAFKWEEFEKNVDGIEDKEMKEQVLQLLRKIRNLTIGELETIQRELREYLLQEEAAGKQITEPEKTLRDIDIIALATGIWVKRDIYYRALNKE